MPSKSIKLEGHSSRGQDYPMELTFCTPLRTIQEESLEQGIQWNSSTPNFWGRRNLDFFLRHRSAGKSAGKAIRGTFPLLEGKSVGWGLEPLFPSAGGNLQIASLISIVTKCGSLRDSPLFPHSRESTMLPNMPKSHGDLSIPNLDHGLHCTAPGGPTGKFARCYLQTVLMRIKLIYIYI